MGAPPDRGGHRGKRSGHYLGVIRNGSRTEVGRLGVPEELGITIAYELYRDYWHSMDPTRHWSWMLSHHLSSPPPNLSEPLQSVPDNSSELSL